LLRSPNPNVRESAAAALVEKHSKLIAPYLVEAAGDPSGELRARACRYLLETGTDLEAVVPILAAAASDKDDNVRADAVLAFGRLLGLRSPQQQLANMRGVTLPEIVILQTDRVVGVRRRELTPGLRAQTIKALRLLLKDHVSNTRIAAAVLLAQLGPDPEVYVDLITATGDSEPGVRFAAARALLKVDQTHDGIAVKTLVALIASPDPISDRSAVLDVVKSTSVHVQDQVVAALASRLADVDSTVLPDVIDALVAAGPRAQAALPALERLLNDEDPVRRESAGIAVATIVGKASPRVLAILLRMIDDVALTRESRQSALGRIRELNVADLIEATPILIRQLGSKDPEVRSAALEMLSGIIIDTPAKMPAPTSGQ
jgi:HEAT repeat protein